MQKETDIASAIGRYGFFRSSVDLLLQEVEEAVKAKKTVVILTGSEENSKKVDEMLGERNVGAGLCARPASGQGQARRPAPTT